MYRCQESWGSSRVGKRSVEVMGVNVRQDIIKTTKSTQGNTVRSPTFSIRLFSLALPRSVPAHLIAVLFLSSSPPLLLSSSPPLLPSAPPRKADVPALWDLWVMNAPNIHQQSEVNYIGRSGPFLAWYYQPL